MPLCISSPIDGQLACLQCLIFPVSTVMRIQDLAFHGYMPVFCWMKLLGTWYLIRLVWTNDTKCFSDAIKFLFGLYWFILLCFRAEDRKRGLICVRWVLCHWAMVPAFQRHTVLVFTTTVFRLPYIHVNTYYCHHLHVSQTGRLVLWYLLSSFLFAWQLVFEVGSFYWLLLFSSKVIAKSSVNVLLRVFVCLFVSQNYVCRYKGFARWVFSPGALPFLVAGVPGEWMWSPLGTF